MTKIALVGFMGCGKTTTANQLKKYYNAHKIFSIDSEIEKNSKTTIKNIFKMKGEKYFRELETKTIENIILNNENYILDLGGGAFVQWDNRKLLMENDIRTIFLDAPLKTIYKRLESQHGSRPMLAEDNWKEKAKDLFNYRYGFYKQADLTIKIGENDTPETVCQILIEALNNIGLSWK